MKKNTISLIVLLVSITTFQAQDINFSFHNAINTNDGTNDFYEVDVMIESTADFKLGQGFCILIIILQLLEIIFPVEEK